MKNMAGLDKVVARPPPSPIAPPRTKLNNPPRNKFGKSFGLFIYLSQIEASFSHT